MQLQSISLKHCPTGELADLLGMHKQQIAFEIIPAALAKLTEARNTEALQVLAENSGMDLATFMSSFGHHAIAKFLYEGTWKLLRIFKELFQIITKACRDHCP